MRNVAGTRLFSYLLIPILLAPAGCASTAGKSAAANSHRTVIDSSVDGDKPSWVKSSKVSWEEGDRIYFKGIYTVRGDERVNGCYLLARLETKEHILAEIRADIKGETNLATDGINESSAPAVSNLLQQVIQGDVRGLKFSEQMHERYLVSDLERVDCFVLAEMKQKDYQALRMRVAEKIAAVDPEARAVMQKRMKRFFANQDEQTAQSGESGDKE